MFKNKKNSIMNPENPNSPFFKGNILKQGTIWDNVNIDDNDHVFTSSCKNLSEINRLNKSDDTYDDYLNSKICSSICWEDDSISSSSYDYNQEFDYNYSYNGYESDNCGYDAHNNDIYDNFDGGLYDLYQNNTFNDY